MTKLNLFVLAVTLVLSCQTACQRVAAEVVLDEDFEDGVADGFVTVTGTFSIGAGLRGSIYGYNGIGIVEVPVEFSVGTVSADFVINSAASGDFEIWFNPGFPK